MATKLWILISWVIQPAALNQQGSVVAQSLVQLPLVLDVYGSIPACSEEIFKCSNTLFLCHLL